MEFTAVGSSRLLNVGGKGGGDLRGWGRRGADGEGGRGGKEKGVEGEEGVEGAEEVGGRGVKGVGKEVVGGEN